VERWRRNSAAVSPPPPLLSRPAPSRVTCAREAWFSFDYRYGMHLRSIMHPRGEVRSPAVRRIRVSARPRAPYAIFHRRTYRIARFLYTPFASIDVVYNHPSRERAWCTMHRRRAKTHDRKRGTRIAVTCWRVSNFPTE